MDSAETWLKKNQVSLIELSMWRNLTDSKDNMSGWIMFREKPYSLSIRRC